jgi:hypothetical protein
LSTGRTLQELTRAELVELCHGLILDNARLNGQLAALNERDRLLLLAKEKA